MIEDVEQRFWDNVDRSGGENACWEWQGLKTHGYGVIHHEGVTYRTHRLAYMLTRGGIAKGKLILHHCDNPACCNPKHLRVGTHRENSLDQRNRKRGPIQKLSITDAYRIHELYANGQTQAEIARKYDVTQTTISCVLRGQTFPDIYDDTEHLYR
jgi:hypothetical protein